MININAGIPECQIDIDFILQYLKNYWNYEVKEIDLVTKNDKSETYVIRHGDLEMYVTNYMKEDFWDSSLVLCQDLVQTKMGDFSY